MVIFLQILIIKTLMKSHIESESDVTVASFIRKQKIDFGVLKQIKI